MGIPLSEKGSNSSIFTPIICLVPSQQVLIQSLQYLAEASKAQSQIGLSISSSMLII